MSVNDFTVIQLLHHELCVWEVKATTRYTFTVKHLDGSLLFRWIITLIRWKERKNCRYTRCTRTYLFEMSFRWESKSKLMTCRPYETQKKNDVRGRKACEVTLSQCFLFIRLSESLLQSTEKERLSRLLFAKWDFHGHTRHAAVSHYNSFLFLFLISSRSTWRDNLARVSWTTSTWPRHANEHLTLHPSAAP